MTSFAHNSGSSRAPGYLRICLLNLLLHYLSWVMLGKYLALWFVLSLPMVGPINTATFELNISQYCPPTYARIYIYPIKDELIAFQGTKGI